MALIATATPAATRAMNGAYDRLFYSSLAITLALIVFIGFAPTYYLRTFNDAPVTISGKTVLSPLAHVHGALFTAWVVLFVVQTALIASHRTKVHQRLGIAGAVLAAVMVAIGLSTAVASAAAGGAPPGAEPLAFLAIPFFDMVLFPIFVGAALWHRRKKETHKRLMVLAYLSIITAALARLPGVIALGPPGFFGLTFLLLLLCIVYDFASRRRVHGAYIWGGGLLVVSVPLRVMISGTDTWMTLAQFLTR
jgi:hypothetical protein